MQRTLTTTYNISCRDDDADRAIAAALDKYPLLERAVLAVCYSTGWVGGDDILRVSPLIDAVNPQCPDDSFDPATLMAILDGDVLIDAEFIEILRGLLPHSQKDSAIKVSGNKNRLEVTFSGPLWRTGMTFEVIFACNNEDPSECSNLLYFPLIYTIQVWDGPNERGVMLLNRRVDDMIARHHGFDLVVARCAILRVLYGVAGGD